MKLIDICFFIVINVENVTVASTIHRDILREKHKMERSEALNNDEISSG